MKKIIDLRTQSGGTSGVNGIDGADGLSAYQIAVLNGFSGTKTQWLESLVGATGSQGIQGVKGDTGLQGIQGIAGTNGTNGTNGVGVPIGGTAGQVLSKIDATDYNTQWVDQSRGFIAQTAVMTATQANSTTTVANVTQLALPMVANGVYQVNCFVTFKSAATTTGLGLYFTSPTGCRCMCEMVVPITSTAVASQLRVIYPNAATATNTGLVVGTGVTAIDSNHTARISGIIRNGANAGNFQIQFRSEIANSAITLQIGSELQLIRIA